MLGAPVAGSRTWMWTMAAPAEAASRADCAICCGVTGTAGFFFGVSKEPVSAQVTIVRSVMSLASPGAWRASARLVVRRHRAADRARQAMPRGSHARKAA